MRRSVYYYPSRTDGTAKPALKPMGGKPPAVQRHLL